MAESENPFHPDLLSSATAILCLGPSNSGKSTLAKIILKKRGKPVTLIGGDAKDFKDSGLAISFGTLDKDAEKLKNCSILVDDLFGLRHSENESLRSLLCYGKRHQNLFLQVNAHSIMHTSLRNLLQHFDILALTKRGGQNSEMVKSIMTVFAIPDTLEQAYTDLRPFQYLLIDLKTKHFDVVNQSLEPAQGKNARLLEQRREAIKKAMTPILDLYPQQAAMAKCHLGYILNNISPLLVAANDFTMKLQSKHSKRECKVSLLDFLLLAQSPESLPSRDQLMLKQYLDKMFHTPQALLKNKTLKK